MSTSYSNNHSSNPSSTLSRAKRRKHEMDRRAALISQLEEAKLKLKNIQTDIKINENDLKEAPDRWGNTKAEITESVVAHFIQTINELRKEKQNAEREVQMLQNELNESPPQVLAPSSVTASTRDRAGGDLELNGRDSGVARHPLFLAVVKSMTTTTPHPPTQPRDEDQSWAQSWRDKAQCFTDAMSIYIGDVHERETFETAFNECLDKVSSPYCQQHWKGLINAVWKAKEDSVFSNEVLYYSEALTSILNSFCNLSQLPLVFHHQYPCPSVKGDSKMDLAASRIWNDLDRVLLSRSLLGIAEVKNGGNSENAKWQLAAYTSELHAKRRISVSRNISIGLVIDKNTIRLYGYLWSQKGIRDNTSMLLEFSLLVECSVSATSTEFDSCLKTYFISLFALVGLQNGVDDPDFCPGITVPPVKKKAFKLFKGDEGGKTYAYKVFDYPFICHGDGSTRSTSSRQPNDNLIRAVHPDLEEEDVKVIDVPSCHLVKVLRMPWFEGGHEPTCLKHIMLLCEQLGLLHNEGHCHGDVLQQNIVFGGDEEEPTTRLIDFDFAHLKEYPRNYNVAFAERHPGAHEMQPLRKIHDVYAVIVILCKYFREESDAGETSSLWEHFFNRSPFRQEGKASLHREWNRARITPQNVGTWIEERKEKLVRIGSEKASKVVKVQTNSPPEKGVQQ